MSIKNKLVNAIGAPSEAVEKVQWHIQRNITGPLLSPWRKGEVVMFHIGRSGSTVLTDLLAQRSDFFWAGELYQYEFWQYPDDELPKDLRLEPDAFIKPYLRQAGHHYFGFEVKFFHLRVCQETLPAYVSALEMLGFHQFIVLKRENFLRKIVSSLIAHQSATDYHHAAGTKAKLAQISVDVNHVSIDYETKSLLAFLEDYEASFAELDQLLQTRESLHLTYEADVAPDPQIGYQRICAFMNLSPQPVPVRLSKVNPFPLPDLIVNFGEVARTLQNTPFEWMLYA